MIHTAPIPSPELRQLIGDFAPWVAEAQWSVLFGGRTNAAWQVSGTDQALVLKLYRASSANPLFPNDAAAEAMMLEHLSGLGIAPELVASFDSSEGHCTLYHAIPGEPWRDGVVDVAAMMQKLHGQEIPSGLRSLPNGSAEILAHGDAILARCKEHSDLVDLRPTLDVAPNLQPVLLHCDMVPGNLITNSDGLHLIDWQCPGVGDPCEDIAIFLSPAMQGLYRGEALSLKDRDLFLRHYQKVADRYLELAPAYHYRMAAYCAWKVENGTPDYEAGFSAEVAALKANQR